MTEQTTQPISTASGARQHGAKTVFWYFSLFWTMAVVAVATGTVWFQLINKFFPLEISYGVQPAFNQQGLKSAVAALIVGAPAFFIFAWLIRKAISRDEIQLKKGARQWVGYLILFIVVATALGDIITTVLTWLNGDFTTRFLLKSLTILIITSWIFAYFWLSLRSEDGLKSSPLPKIAAGISALVMLISLIIAFTLIESPAVARAKAYDQQRINDLSTIQSMVDNYYVTNKKLPDNLDLLKNTGTIPVDPTTGESYTYQTLSKTQYKLCATFTTDNKTPQSPQATPVYPIYGIYLHTTGNNCYSLIAPDISQPQKPLPVPITK